MAASPMSYLQTHGPAGDPATLLGWGLGIVSAVVLLVVVVLLLAGLLRQRPGTPALRELAVESDSGGLRWIYVGVGISTVVLVACAVWTMTTLQAIAMPARAADLTLQVTASQWWWKVRYVGAQPAGTFDTANEIHIPVGHPVRVELSSNDVIHSFWIPQLAGKTDVIPGKTNVMWLQAARPGVFRGQCGEFCGAQHAHMAMYVVAQDEAAFAAWRQQQLQPAVDGATTGQKVFDASCAACHSVRGTAAGGIFGPDLTHLMARSTIAAGMLPNTPGQLAAWISNPQSIKPGTRMPAPTLSPAELQAVVAYLQTLN
ncbi:cytochrome c oxidase subunit II [Caenimonas terrae]|uniref:Cytochrome aa3 subunit 2 n=1 Tax=Caenimonas terrae TaxID=696074 RepID=A0ABW0NKQ6_9BURK